MAIDTNRYYYLFDPAFQIENNAGKPVVGGHVEVFVAGTDEQVITYQDWDGTRNPFKIPLKADGRAVILVEVGTRYDAYAYDSFNNLVFSRLNILPMSDASINGLTRVYHDSTLNGKGTSTDPLKVNPDAITTSVHSSWPITGDGTSENPLTINDRRALAVDDTMTAYNSTVDGVNSLVIGVSPTYGFMNDENLEEKDGTITGYKGKPFAAGNAKEYVGGANIVINDTVISVTGLDTYATTASVTGMMDVSKLEINDNKITGYDGTAFAGQGGSTYTGVYPIEVDNDENTISVDSIPLIAGAGIEINENVISCTASGPGSTYTAGNNIDITNSIISVTGLDTYATTASLAGYATTAEIDGKMDVNKLEINDNTITGYNGTPFAGQGGSTYTGVYPIEVDNDTNTIGADTIELTAGEGIDISNGVITCTASGPGASYTAGNNIDITSNVISVTGLDAYATTADLAGKMDESKLEVVGTEITGYDGKTFPTGGGSGGKVYTGVDPIVVDNTNNTISITGTETDETVLWEGESTGNDTSVTLSEPLSNFVEFKLYTSFEKISDAQVPAVHHLVYADGTWQPTTGWRYLTCVVDYSYKPWENDDINLGYATYIINSDKTVIKCHTGKYNANMTAKQTRNLTYLYKVVGVKRKVTE